MVKQIGLLGLVFMLSACLTSPVQETQNEQPSWINRLPANNASYVYGLGSSQIEGDAAAKLNQAKQNAQLAILTSLSVTIEGGSLSATQVNDDKVNTQKESWVKSSVQRMNFSSYELQDQYEEGKRLYVLMRLDIAAEQQLAKRSIAPLVSELDRKEQTYRSPLDEYLWLIKKKKAYTEYLDEFNKLQALDNNSSKPSAVVSFEFDIKELPNQISFGLVPQMAKEIEFEDRFTTMLSELGFTFNSQSKQTWLYSVKVSQEQQNDRWYVFSDVDVKLLDHNQVLFQRQLQGKGIASDFDAAYQKSLKKAANQIVDDFFSSP